MRIGGCAGSQKHCKGILASSLDCHRGFVSACKHTRRDRGLLGCATVDRNGQHLRVVDNIVRLCFQTDHDGVGRICLEVPLGIKRIAIGIRAFIAGIAHRQAGGRRLDLQVKNSLALDEVGDCCRGVGDWSRNDGHNDLVGGCRLMVIIRGTGEPEGIGADVQASRRNLVYCIVDSVRLIVDHDIRGLRYADNHTIAVGERHGTAICDRNCTFLVVDLQRQVSGGFCDLEGRRNSALIFALAGRGQRRSADVDVVFIGQIIIHAVFKGLFAKRDSRGGLDLITVIVFEGADCGNGSAADVGGAHSQNAGRFRSEAADLDRDGLAIVFSDCQFGVLCRVSRVHAGAKLNPIAACVLRGNNKAGQVQLIAAVVDHVGFACNRNAGHGIRLYCDRDIAGIAVIAGRDNIFALHKASSRKRDGDAAGYFGHIAVFVDVFTDKVFCDLPRRGGGEEIRCVVREAGNKCRALDDGKESRISDNAIADVRFFTRRKLCIYLEQTMQFLVADCLLCLKADSRQAALCKQLFILIDNAVRRCPLKIEFISDDVFLDRNITRQNAFRLYFLSIK